METLKPASSTYLLDAGIETLHQQSMEWLEDIAFWRDEAAFLYALEVGKTSKEVPVGAKDKLKKTDNELIRISAGDLDDLYKKVEDHEKYLSYILEGKRENEEVYRERHKQIANEMIKFGARFRNLKRNIFDILKSTKVDLAVNVKTTAKPGKIKLQK